MFIKQWVRKLTAMGHFIIAPPLLYPTLCYSTTTLTPSPSPLSSYVTGASCQVFSEGLVRQTCEAHFQGHTGVLYFSAPAILNTIESAPAGDNWLVLLDGKNDVIYASDSVQVVHNNMHLQGIVDASGNYPKLRVINDSDVNSLINVITPAFQISNLDLDDVGAGNARALLELSDYTSLMVKNNKFTLTGRLPYNIYLNEPKCNEGPVAVPQPANIIAENIITTAFLTDSSGGSIGLHIVSNCDFRARVQIVSRFNTYEIDRNSIGIAFQSGALVVNGDIFTQTSENQAGDTSFGVYFYEVGSESLGDESPTDDKYNSIIARSFFRANGFANMYGINLKHHQHDPHHLVEIRRNRFTGVKNAIAFSNASPIQPSQIAMDDIAPGSICNIWEPDDNSDVHPCAGTPASGFVHFVDHHGNDYFCYNEDVDARPDSPDCDASASSVIPVMPSATAPLPGASPAGLKSPQNGDGNSRLGVIVGGAIGLGTVITVVVVITVAIWRFGTKLKKPAAASDPSVFTNENIGE